MRASMPVNKILAPGTNNDAFLKMNRLRTRGCIRTRSLNDYSAFDPRNSKMPRKVQQIDRAD